jgi:hypothetical protein
MEANYGTGDVRYRGDVEDGSRVGEAEIEPVRGLYQQFEKDVSTCRGEQVTSNCAGTCYKDVVSASRRIKVKY